MAHFSASQSVTVPDIRIHKYNDTPIRTDGAYVLYWMVANRRTKWNFALQRACLLSKELNKPLLVFEALRIDYPWACDRFHRFILDGMHDNKREFQQAGITYYSYTEPSKGAAKGLLSSLCADACALISDDFPSFFIPHMQKKVAESIPIYFEVIDSNGIYPMRAAERFFTTAASFRRYLQKNISEHLAQFPKPSALSLAIKGAHIAPSILATWPATSQALLDGTEDLHTLPIKHHIEPTGLRGGEQAAQQRLSSFFSAIVHRYHTDRNRTDIASSSGLSPYFHFGHISVHQVIDTLFTHEKWTIPSSPPKSTGSRSGWWGMTEYAEAFIDEMITWRELGYIFNFHHPNTYDKLSSLPDWAKKTISEHKDDPRPIQYTLEELATSKTHDPIWNAAQNQLRKEGIIHNYLRMLWGKKIYEWSPDAQTAIDRLIELNNRYALDGRNPNSYSGIFWIVGRFDRAWGPIRPIFGKLRYMSSDSTKRKLKLTSYLKAYTPEP